MAIIMKLSNESNAHVVISDEDGKTIFNGRRTVRKIDTDGYTKRGVAIVNQKEYDVVLATNWKWTGPAYAA